jgi:3-oxoacyl-[acyl-carrier-protein] synthase III
LAITGGLGKTEMTQARIVGTGGYQPGEPISNEVIESLVGELPEDVAERLSIERRFWVIDIETGEHRENNSDMAFKATQTALESAGMAADEIEFFVLATGSPDYHLPPVVNLVQESLGLERCATLELRSGGAGFVQGLDVARLYLEQGIFETAVVIGSEAVSPVIAPAYLGKEPRKIRVRDRIPCYMFSDGAGAAVLRGGHDDGGIIGGATACIGGKRKPGIQLVGGGTHAPFREQMAKEPPIQLRLDVAGTGSFTPHFVIEALSNTLLKAGVDADSIDHCMIEVNVSWIREALTEAGLLTADWKALEGKIFDNLSQMGACGCALLPLLLDDAWRTGLIEAGQRVILVGLEATKWIYAGLVLDWTARQPPASESKSDELVC